MPHYEVHPAYEAYEITTPEVLTEEIEKARKHLATAIEAKGADYIYQKQTGIGSECLYLNYESLTEDEEVGFVYSDPTGPSCIVGHVLVYCEVPFPEITRQEGTSAAAATEEIGVFTSQIVREALNNAQMKQDSGHTWGEAVEEFEFYIDSHTIKVDA